MEWNWMVKFHACPRLFQDIPLFEEDILYTLPSLLRNYSRRIITDESYLR